MKPSWNEAPAWAKWMAMDSGGGCYSNEVDLFLDQEDGCWYGREAEETSVQLGGHDYSKDAIDASSTLEGRN